MKIKSELFVFLIIISILFSITAVSASEIQSNITEDNDYQSNRELTQDSIELNSNLNSEGIEDILGVSKTDNIKSGPEDESSFTALATEINQSKEELNLTHDYKFDESIDKDNLTEWGFTLISVDKNKFVLNGNNHVLDGAGSGAYLNFENQEGEIIINDLTFRNYNQSTLKTQGKLTLNNVNFTDFNNTNADIIVTYTDARLIANNCSFYSNQANHLIRGDYSSTIINNSRFYGNHNNGAAILVNRWQLIINNSSFENFTYKNGAMIEFKGDRFEIINSKFINAYSNLSGGAILGKYFANIYSDDPDYSNSGNYPILFKDCIFTNLSCSNNGGTIHIDLDSAAHNIPKTMNVINSNFTDCRAKFGGAISILGGTLNVLECNFMNNTANFEGGAIYSSWTNLNISKSNFTNNTAAENAGAIYFDKHKLTIKESNFKDNKAIDGPFNSANAIYAHDVEAHFSDSTFDNGGVAVYADFASDSKLENIEKNDDIFLMDNQDYIVSVENKGIKINLTDNEIIVDELPSKFDARDWGWTTPGKIQGDNDDCWAFATVASLETSLLKSTGIAYNLSQNYAQKLQLKYYNVGDLRNSLTGFSYSGLGYALSWYGVLSMDSAYDDRGMIADTDMDVERIHVQDAAFIYTGTDDTINQLKRAILKYGAVAVQKYVNEPEDEIPTEGEDISLMDHDTHFITLIGWDDNVAGHNDNKGAWITKDSLSGFDQNSYTNFPQIDYYAIAPQRVAIAYIFENAIDYHVNYQTDLTGLAGFDGNYTYYSNEFTSKYDELIGAVGTYFNESGIDYSFDIFVNGNKVHSQSGISEFAGFRTIVLNKYIPIKKEDQFKVVFKSNAVPYQAWSRMHYLNGTSLVSKKGSSWIDFAPLNKTVCLKVYTVVDDTKIIDNKDISVDYGSGSYFSVKVVTDDGRPVGAGEKVSFKINGKTTSTTTNNDGIAKVKITNAPGTYNVVTTHNGKTYKNKLTVKLNLKICKIMGNKNIKVDYASKSYFSVKVVSSDGKTVVSGASVKFKINGKTTTVKTNKKGIAKIKITGAPKKYTIKTTFNGKTYKNTITVKHVLKASKVTVKKTGKKFTLKAKLKINGKLQKGKKITFKFNGKTYKVKTNKKGIAQKTFNKKIIKKLKKGKTYTVKITYLKDTIKSSIKVK
ncbi:lectin like domain-containing protein [Methanobrevibacter sp.]|uniref:lectin like domain-containing protein n=1 Tax=Methanobrevibacter sp. TaxID=66852 RepID=UPI0038685C4D